MFHPLRDAVAQAAIAKTVGPAPWYWRTFPQDPNYTTGSFEWLLDTKDGRGCHYPILKIGGQTRLAVGIYSRPFLVPPNGVGLWFPEIDRGRSSRVDKTRVIFFDSTKLPQIVRPSRFTKLDLRFHAGIEPIAEFSLPSGLSGGESKIAIPAAFKSITELLIVSHWSGPSTDTAIFVVYPTLDRVEVFPQRWFTAKEFDIGYQWITRVTRHPKTGRFIGDGVRMGSFELDETGCELGRWITRSV